MRTVPLKRIVEPTRPIMYGIVLPGPNQLDGPMIVKGGDVKPERLEPTRLCRTTPSIEVGYARSRLRGGDIVVAIRGGIGDVELVPESIDGANITQDVARISCGSDADARFVRYAIASATVQADVSRRTTGATVRGLNIEDLKEVAIPFPPRQRQTAVADFLDAEMTDINALIVHKRRMVELLDERRRLIGEEALASLRSNVESVPLKHLVRESDARLGDREDPLVLSVSIHKGVVPRSEVSEKASRADAFTGYKVCCPGDIAINRMRAFQGGLGVVRNNGVVSPDYTVLKVGWSVSADYLHFVMRSSWFVSEMTMRVRGIGSADQTQVRTPRINFADLGLIEIPVPSAERQAAFAQIGRNAELEAAALIRKLDRQIGLLAEHKRALITAAVLGELDEAIEIAEEAS